MKNTTLKDIHTITPVFDEVVLIAVDTGKILIIGDNVHIGFRMNKDQVRMIMDESRES